MTPAFLFARLLVTGDSRGGARKILTAQSPRKLGYAREKAVSPAQRSFNRTDNARWDGPHSDNAPGEELMLDYGFDKQ